MAVQLSLFDDASPASAPQAAHPVAASRVLAVRGALAAEAVLLERLAALAAEARRDPRLLARPLRVVVPSRSLRGHLLSAITRSSGIGWLGISVQTLGGLAAEVLERAGEGAASGRLLLGWAAARFARQEPDLARSLGRFQDGFAAVGGTVRDLLDAGLEPAHLPALEEVLAADGRAVGASREEVGRAGALVRIAAGADDLLRAWGVGGHGALFKRAADLLRTGGEEALPARALFIHGFADATGVAADLLESLLRREAAWLLLDRPPEPGDRGFEGATESAFTEHLAERLRGFGLPAPAVPALPGRPARLSFFEAPGVEAEAREAACRVRALLDGGARPEGIAILARDLSPYRFPLARHLGRLGVPFSAVGVRGGLAGAGRLVSAFLELLERGVETPANRWLDAVATLPAGPRVDVRLALAALGAGRVAGVAAISLSAVLGKRNWLPLPIRQGLAPADPATDGDAEEGAEGERRSRDTRRKVQGWLLRQTVAAARRVRDRFAGWPVEAPLGEHLARLGALLGGIVLPGGGGPDPG